MLTSASGGVTLAYDPMLRLYQLAGGATTRFGYDGIDLVAETDGAGTVLRRYAPGPGPALAEAGDEPIVWYEGGGTTDRRFLHADERGSVIATTDSGGNMLAINKYDDFGKPQSTNSGRLQYTGQKWIGEVGLYDYKARMYAPHLSRFLQTDPIGYGGGINLYAYVRNDPVNLRDPLGLSAPPPATDEIAIICIDCGQTVDVWGYRIDDTVTYRRESTPFPAGTTFGDHGMFTSNEGSGGGSGTLPDCSPLATNSDNCTITVTAQRPPPRPFPRPPRALARPNPSIRVPVAAQSGQDFCGSGGNNVPDGNWGEACDQHDKCYGTPGAFKEACDLALVGNITAACSGKIFVPALCFIPGVIYGSGLIFFGVTPFYHPSRDAYNDAQRNRR